MDTTYINTLLVVFLVAAALAINVGYMYVSEEDLQHTAETSALAGTQALQQRIQAQVEADPTKLRAILEDTVQSAARTAAIETASGKHSSIALMEITNNDTNTLTTRNDITVGFWNISTNTYTPGETPVNAMQVRTRRTAESDSVGLGSVGSFIAKISGVQKFNFTPEAITALPPRANANIVICTDACDDGCKYPNICSIPERKMVRDTGTGSDSERYAYTTLLYQVTSSMKFSDLICLELPPQEVCGKRISILSDSDNSGLRDIESMMYNPNVDASNKEFDKGTGAITGWWVIAPVTDCPLTRQKDVFEQHTVSRYALIRIRRICVDGPSGCKQTGTSFKAPAAQCSGAKGLYIDRLSYVDCGSKELIEFPGLHPVLVK